MRVLLFHGENHRFSDCVPVLQEILARPAGAEVVLTENRRAFRDGEAQNFDVFVLGSGFTRVERQPDGTARRVPEFEEEDLEALLAWVAGGKGFVGLHGTAWWIGGRAYDLVGGHANWHPPGLRFIVEPNEAHPVTAGLPSFEVEDEIYMCAWEPELTILAQAEWQGRKFPVAWCRPFGAGRVFYTALGHSPATFRPPTMGELMIRGTRWAAECQG